VHTPSAEAPSAFRHTSQLAVHGVSQQTPLAQEPLAQSESALHAPPSNVNE
jgi:hypothetical protein